MPVVQRLPDDLANQIAAGEVVERPASIVKELLENALDAGATRIRVEVEGGGLTLLRVIDDGVGMSDEDARLAIERHATSKIRSLDDLLALRTFGFRGEALPSIASVSRFTLRTRTRDQEAGIELTIEGGSAPATKPCGTAPGAVIEVRDLFYNVPARRKFLKSAGTESAHITDVVEALALGAPTLTVTLVRDGRVAREWLREAGHAARARASFAGEELAELEGKKGSLEVLALLGRPERARASAGALKVFVNGRLVRDRVLVRTVLQAYGSVLPPGRYPVGAVFLTVPPDRVDVNVHPQKAEVRFADTRAVTDALFQLLSLELGRSFGLAPVPRYAPYATAPAIVAKPVVPAEAVAAAWSWPTGPAQPEAPASSVREGQSTEAPGRPSPVVIESDPWGLGEAVTPGVATPGFAASGAAAAIAAALGPQMNLPSGGVPYATLRFVAQLRQTFLLCEGADGVYVLDQHAAAERVTFHRLKQSFVARSVAVQPLLFPAVVAVMAQEAAFVDDEHELLLAAGVDVRSIGPEAVAVHGVPQLLTRASPERLLRDLLAQASRTSGGAFQDAIDMALATMACHGSVRAGDRMAAEEATALLAALDEVDFAGHCPHGRPIITLLRWDDLERKVGRR